jgi:glycosyltransferase involved in cell wall biosynthesis
MATAHGSPKVSVIIPCYNASGFIQGALDSALNQTERDTEIIVVDDGSTDSAPALVYAMSQHEPRIRLLSQANGGVSVARNTGILAARARVIALLDADDLWAPDHLAVHLRRLAHAPRLGVSFSPARIIDTTGRLLGETRPKLRHLVPGDFLMGNPTTTCSTLVIRRDVFRDTGLFRTTMRHNEDLEWLFRVSLSGWVTAGDPVARVDYRTSPGGLAADLEGMRHGFEVMLEEARKLAPVLVQRNEVRARAAMFRYLARRAIRLGLPAAVARRYALAALRTAPAMLLREPRSTAATLAAALLPRAVLQPVLMHFRPTTAGA